MDQQQIITLLRKYAAGTLTADEHAAFMQWLEQANAEEFHAMLDQSGVEEEHLPQMPFSAIQRLEQRLDAASAPRIHRFHWKPWAAAAAVLCLLVAGYYWYNPPQNDAVLADVTHDVPPGSNKATLTLGDGSVISLDDVSSGTLGHQGNTAVIKKDSGLLAYHSDITDKSIVQYNTLTTPRGGQYRVVLPDGSEVWLNASSSLYYPTTFKGKEREVVLKGEAYFEIAKVNGQPFRLKVDDMSILVLGTHFNVNAYPDEKKISTTLLEGAVKLEKGSQAVTIKPGQEGSIDRDGGDFSISTANTELATAWKKGLFYFEHADIATITRQIARWYDVDIVFQGKMPTRRFMGVMSRNASLSVVLKILEGTDVHFRQEGRKLIVMPAKD